MDETKDNAAPEQDAAQPEATGTPPAKSAAETKLEGQLADAKTKGEGYKKERDKAKRELADVTGERDDLRTQNARLAQELADAKAPAAAASEQAATTTQEPSEADIIRDILKRNGLKKCWMLAGSPCFSEDHAREYAGADFDSLAVISVEEDAEHAN